MGLLEEPLMELLMEPLEELILKKLPLKERTPYVERAVFDHGDERPR